MAAHGITVKPMRMGDVSLQTRINGTYVPPSKRSGVKELPKTIDMSDKSFPVLKMGETKEKGPDIFASDDNGNSLIDKIKEQIRLDVVIRSKPVETNPLKMTEAERSANGWEVLKRKPISVNPQSNLLLKYSKEAPEGMSFEDYMEYVHS